MNIVIVNRWPRFSDGRRWDNELTRYEEFIDHRRHRVSYVVDGPGAAGVLAPRSDIAHLVQISDVNRYDELLAAMREITERLGPIDHVIVLSEFTLEIAAQVRAALNIPGPTPADVAVYRDKVRMKEVVAAHGIRVPRFARCIDVDQSLAFAQSLGYPVILKPVDGAASIGVRRIDDPAALAAVLPTLDLSRHEIEEFIDGAIYHVDGFADAASQVPFQVASRYINNCLDFTESQPLGSVVLNDSPLRERIEAFARDCIAALRLVSTPFHLELFIDRLGDSVFLEIGARVGGSEVPHLIYKLFGVNLFEIWLKGLTGTQAAPPHKRGDPSGGWLVIPKPKSLPCRVLRASPMRGRIGSLWRELVPDVGDILEPGGSYDALHSGRFILIGRTETEIAADIQQVIRDFEFRAEPVKSDQ